MPWEKISSKIAYQTPRLKVREDNVITPDGKDSIYSVVQTGGGVGIVALDDKDNIYLVGIDRYPTGLFSWEIISGGIDNEDSLIAAKRELKEELGLEANNWEKIARLQTFSGISDEIADIYLAKDLVNLPKVQESEGITKYQTTSPEKIIEMIQSGEITDAETIAALFQAFLKLGVVL